MLRITKGSIFLEIPNGRTAGIEPLMVVFDSELLKKYNS